MNGAEAETPPAKADKRRQPRNIRWRFNAADELTEIRLSLGLTQKQMASAIGISHNGYCNQETGQPKRYYLLAARFIKEHPEMLTGAE